MDTNELLFWERHARVVGTMKPHLFRAGGYWWRMDRTGNIWPAVDFPN